MSHETIFYILVIGIPVMMVAILIFGKDIERPDETDRAAPAGRAASEPLKVDITLHIKPG